MNKKIDIKKYEGHTEGPWQVVKHTGEWDDEPHVEGVVLITSPNPHPIRVAVCDNRWKMDDNELEERLQHSTTGATAREMFNANEQLIADAPLILDAYNKKCIEAKWLREALQIITKDLDSAIAQGYIDIRATNGIDVTKIRNFANDASI